MSSNGRYRVEPCNQQNNDGNSVNPIAAGFFSLPPVQFSLLATLLGLLLIDNLDVGRQNALGNFIVSVGQAILTAVAQRQSLQSSNTQNDRIRKQIQMLKQQISALEQDLDNVN